MKIILTLNMNKGEDSGFLEDLIGYFVQFNIFQLKGSVQQCVKSTQHVLQKCIAFEVSHDYRYMLYS